MMLMKTTIQTPEELRQAVKDRLAAARQGAELATAAKAVADLEQAESKALAELQQPPTLEDPFRHDSARLRLATVREQLALARAALRPLADAAENRAAESLHDLHDSVWGRVETAVRDLIAAEQAAAALQTAAGAAGSGLFFGGLHELTAVRLRLETIDRGWSDWKGGRR
jgi:hypothetical protein